jgi:hypothetical protein
MNEITSSADSVGIASSTSADDVFKRLGES